MNIYRILSAPTEGIFADRLDSLNNSFQQLLASENKQGRELLYIKVFLSDIQNQYETLLNSQLHRNFRCDAVTIVEQPPLNCSKISLLIITSDSPRQQSFHAMRLTPEEAQTTDAYEQTVRLFHKYIDATGSDATEMKTHLVRTWIYVSDIDTDYPAVVKARNDIFSKHGLTADTHFVASTGIGGHSATPSAKVAIDFLTFPRIKESHKQYLQALDHLNPTHEYGVAFERGTCVSLPHEKIYFISGTASIDRQGNVLHLCDVEKQTARLLDNIEALLNDGGATLGDVNYFIIYLRDPSDYSLVDTYMQTRFPRTPRIILQAKVCRPQWLVEMECSATRLIH